MKTPYRPDRMAGRFNLGRIGLLLLGGLLPASLPAPAYMKLGDIKGEATDSSHMEWIDIQSLSSFLYTPILDGVAYPAYFGDIQVSKQLDKSSPKLMEACANGTVLPSMELQLTRQSPGGPRQYFEYRLRDVLVSNFQTSASGAELPQESFSLNYAKIEWAYRQFEGDSDYLFHAEAYWDIPLNEGGGNSGAGPGEPGGGWNSPPNIDPITAQTVSPGQVGKVDIHVSDSATPAEDLQITVSTTRPDLVKNLVVVGTGETRSLSFSVGSLYSGSAPVTVSVTDGSLSRSASFAVLIDVAMTPYEAFQAAYFSEEEVLDQVLSSPIGDPDGDGLATVMEFALGTNPREYTHPQDAVRVTRVDTPEGPAIQLDFWRNKEAGKLGPTPWMAPESLVYRQYRQGNPLYTENTHAGENPLYERVSATILLDQREADVHFLRMAVEVD